MFLQFKAISVKAQVGIQTKKVGDSYMAIGSIMDARDQIKKIPSTFIGPRMRLGGATRAMEAELEKLTDCAMMEHSAIQVALEGVKEAKLDFCKSKIDVEVESLHEEIFKAAGREFAKRPRNV